MIVFIGLAITGLFMILIGIENYKLVGNIMAVKIFLSAPLIIGGLALFVMSIIFIYSIIKSSLVSNKEV